MNAVNILLCRNIFINLVICVDDIYLVENWLTLLHVIRNSHLLSQGAEINQYFWT